MTSLTDRAVLVTGANRGMGRAYVDQLLERGVAKVYAAARNPESIDHTDPRVVPVRLDLTDPVSITALAASATDVSVVVNNAGVSLAGDLLDTDQATLRSELETNLLGPLALAAAYADRLAESGGVLVNVASALSWISLGGTYGVSKAALWSATDAVRLQLAPRGVQVVGVYVGYVDTDMTAGVDAEKSDPADVVRQVLDGIEAGASEVLADQTSRYVRSTLTAPLEQRYPALAPADA